MNGYHYRFADFETDVDKLSARFNLSIVRTEEAAIKMTVTNRVEATIVSDTSLGWFLLRNPEYHSKILTSDKYDTAYSRHFLVKKNSFIKVSELNDILLSADEKGLLAPIYKKYGLTKPSFN